MDPRPRTNQDLEAVLATLSRYNRISGSEPPETSLETSFVPATGSLQNQNDQSSTIPRSNTHNVATVYEPVVNPVTILDWSTALRHVMRLVAKNDILSHQIKKVRLTPGL